MSARDGKLVYSTSGGRMCPGCGWPLRPGSGQAGDGCKCSTTTAASSVPTKPSQIVAKLRMEKAGRGGKTVTVVDNLPNNAAFLKELSQELKRACGTGGAVRDGGVELQGDLRDRVRGVLAKKGYIVKG
jgi:translation initiation factor 1